LKQLTLATGREVSIVEVNSKIVDTGKGGGGGRGSGVSIVDSCYGGGRGYRSCSIVVAPQEISKVFLKKY